MDKRIPHHLKGKGIDRGYSPPPRRRIQAPEMDTSDLIEANSLTLMGQVQGLPKHYWKPEMLTTIGEELGEIMDMEITNSSAKIRVLIDGLKPLIKDTMVDFPDGSEALVFLEYKNLKNHCSYCQRLSHEKQQCPGLLEENKKKANSAPAELPLAPREVSRNYYTPKDNFAAPNSSGNRAGSHVLPKELSSKQGRQSDSWRSRDFAQNPSKDHLSARNVSEVERSHRRPHASTERHAVYRPNESNRHASRSYDSSRTELRRNFPRHSSHYGKSNYQWRERETTRYSPRPDSSENSRTRRPPLERTLSSAEVAPPPPPPIPTNEEIMGDLREVTLQYVNCADPTESAARKRRVIQGEERGLMAETASQMLESALLSNQAYLATEEAPQQVVSFGNHDLPRLSNGLSTTIVAPAKKKRGRPPLNKSLTKAASPLMGAKSSKRNKGIIQNSPKRKNTPEKGESQRQGVERTSKTTKAKQKLNLQAGSSNPSSSQNSPRINFIPAITKNPDDVVLKSLDWMHYTSHKLIPPHSPGGGICTGRDLIKSHLGKAIGSGNDTLIWNEPWISLSSPVSPMGPPTEQAQPSKLGARDRYVWLLTKSGEYSAKTGYHAATSMRNQPISLAGLPFEFNWNKEIWNKQCSPKVKFFLWKAMKNALPVGANLKARGINPTASCPHCGEDESCLHLFFHCSLAQQVWNQAPFKCSLEPSRISSLKLGIEASNHLTCLPPTGIGHGLLFPWIMWTIWTCRNKKIFDQKSISSQEIISQATVAAKEWIGARLCHQSPQILSSINPIPEIGAGTIRCFTDAAWRKDSREAGFGWIFIDPWSPSES
ncbi:unnamed protein product, partial [Arabidopsis halleri]